MEKVSVVDKVIEHLTSGGYPLSSVDVGDVPIHFLDEISKMISIYGEFNSQFKPTRAVYKTKAGFYIYVDRIQNAYFNCVVYFDVGQMNEVKFFVDKLKKKTNGDTNV
jgi:hypothetical protein